MKIASYDTCLTDSQWECIRPHMPKAAKTGRPRTCLRQVLDAVLYIVKTGCHWRSLPKEFPPRSTIFGYFRAWTKNGFLLTLHNRLRNLARGEEGRKRTPTAAILDSQTVRSAGMAQESGYDAGKKTKGRKRFILVDTLGHILALAVLPADVPERAGGKVLLDDALKRLSGLKKIWVDGGYSGEDFAAHVRELRPDTKVEVVNRIEGASGFHVLPRRWVVERTFACRALTKGIRGVGDPQRTPDSVADPRVRQKRLAYTQEEHSVCMQ